MAMAWEAQQERAKRLADALYDAEWDEASGLTLLDCLATVGLKLEPDTEGEAARAYVEQTNRHIPTI